MEKVSYRTDVFTDFTGKERQFVLCAISTDNEDLCFGEKSVFLGLAVQSPIDSQRNEELAKTIAKGKALSAKRCLGILSAIGNKGLINSRVVEALLLQEAEYFKANPGKYIKGYDKDKALFLSSKDRYYQKFKIVE
jgi:hypothetical protein